MRTDLRILSTLAMVLALAITAGCSKESRTNRVMEKAEAFYREGEFEAAEIEYLNALRLDPQQPVALSRLAVMFCRQGRWQLAAPILMRSVQIMPEDLELRRWAGTFYLASGKLDEARLQADYILAQEPTNAEAMLILAEASRKPQELEAFAGRIDDLREQVGDQAAFHLAWANVQLRSGAIAEAETEVRRALELDSESALGQVILGQILAARGLKKESEIAYARGFSLFPKDSLRRIQWPVYLLDNGLSEQSFQLLQEMNSQNPGAVWILVPLSRAALDLGKRDESEQWIKEALGLDARNVEAQTLQARVNLSRGKTEEALETLKRLVRDQPDSAQMNYQLALAYIASGDAVGAVSTLKRVLELNPQAVPPAFMLAEIHLRQGDVTSAQVVLNGLAKRLPEDRRVKVLLAEAMTQGGALPEAAAIYQNLLQKTPDDAGTTYRLGQVLLLQGQQAKARAMFETVVTLAPDFLPAVSYLADLDFRDRDLGAALARLQTQVERHPESAASRFLLGQAHLANGDAAAAELEFKQVVELEPDQPQGYLALARIYTARTNRLEDARSQLEALRARSTGNVQALLMLAMLDSAQEDYSSARSRYEELLKVQPDNVLALNNLASLYSGRLSDPARAVELARRARNKVPRDPSIADTYGWALLQQGNQQAALQVLLEAAANLPANPDVLYHLGMAYYLGGMEKEARKNFEMALQLRGNEKNRESIDSCLKVLAVSPESDHEHTLELLNKTLQARPADPVALNRLARVCETGGDNTRVVQLYESAYQSNSNSLPVLLGLARAYSLVPGLASNAMPLARTARKLAPQNPAVSKTLGQLAFRESDYKWAVSLLEESEERQPGDPEVLWDLAVAYYSVGRLAEAALTLERAAQSGADGRALQVQRFQRMLALQLNLQDPATARKMAEEALAEEPASVVSRMVLGMAAERMGDHRLAADTYRAVLEVYPEFVPAMKRLAILEAEHLGNDNVAYEYGMKVREAGSTDPELARSLGKVMYRRGDYLYASQLLREGLAEPSESGDELFYLGLSQLRLGMNPAARENLSRALELNADHRLASESRKALETLK